MSGSQRAPTSAGIPVDPRVAEAGNDPAARPHFIETDITTWVQDGSLQAAINSRVPPHLPQPYNGGFPSINVPSSSGTQGGTPAFAAYAADAPPVPPALANPVASAASRPPPAKRARRSKTTYTSNPANQVDDDADGEVEVDGVADVDADHLEEEEEAKPVKVSKKGIGRGNGREVKEGKRAEQNRLAQRAFRERKDAKMRNLETQLEELTALKTRWQVLEQRERDVVARESALANLGTAHATEIECIALRSQVQELLKALSEVGHPAAATHAAAAAGQR